jgi:hypothetical protein
MRCSRKMERYLSHRAAGEVRHLLERASDLPSRAELLR